MAVLFKTVQHRNVFRAVAVGDPLMAAEGQVA